MIQSYSRLKVIDNSGARQVRCIRVLKKSPKSLGRVGDLIRITVQSLRNRGNIRVKRGEIHYAIVVRVAHRLQRHNGLQVKFSSNAVIVLNQKKMSFGTRFFTVVAKELRFKKYVKLLSMVPRTC